MSTEASYHPSYHRALTHFAAKLLVQAENQPQPVRDHLRLVAAELQCDAIKG